jgi:hypothetical protein
MFVFINKVMLIIIINVVATSMIIMLIDVNKIIGTITLGRHEQLNTYPYICPYIYNLNK